MKPEQMKRVREALRFVAVLSFFVGASSALLVVRLLS